jgi:hypothetical protein
MHQVGGDHVLFENGQAFLCPDFWNEGVVVVGMLRVETGGEFHGRTIAITALDEITALAGCMVATQGRDPRWFS